MIAVPLYNSISVTPMLLSVVLGTQDGMAGSNTPAIIMLCFALTLGLLFYSFYFPDESIRAPEKDRLAFLRERKDAVYENLRDLNFEYRAGKFPKEDYEQMRTTMEDEAAAVLAEIDDIESGWLVPATGAERAILDTRRTGSSLKGVKQ